MSHDPTPNRDRGAALLLALVVVTGVAVAISAALGFAATSVGSSSNAYRPARASLYGADAAVKIATKYIAANPTAGTATGTTCIATDLNAGTINGKAVSIQVCPETGSFTQVADLETYSLLTLGSDSNELGIDINKASSGENSKGMFLTNGKVHSNNNVVIDDQFVVTNGDVTVRGTCSTSKITVDSGKSKTCSSSSVSSVSASSVAITPVVSDVIATAPSASGTCSSGDSGNKIVTLSPGKYTSAPSIGSNCKYVWMKPGVYYFEGVSWTISDDVVAGTLKSGNTTASSSDFSSFGSNCDGTNTDNGVEIILGSDSRLTLDGGTLEVCGRTHGTKVVAVYGPTADLKKSTSTTTDYTSDPSSTSNTSNWSNSSDAKVINGTSATRTISKKSGGDSNANSGRITLSSFSSFSPASGSTVKIAVATKADRTGSSSTYYGQLKLNKSGGSCTIDLVAFTTTLTTTEYDFCSGVTPSTLTSIDFYAYNNTTSQDVVVSLDGIQMRWSETTTSETTILKAQSGSVTTVPSSGTATSAIGTASTGANVDALWLNGITYMPLARVTVDVATDSKPVFGRAAILRSLYVNSKASQMAKGPSIGVGGTKLTDGSLTINAVVGGQTWVSSHVKYTVSGNAVTATTIDNWVVRR